MEIFLLFKALLSLLAAFFIGYVPVYFLFEYKKEHKKNFNSGCNNGYSNEDYYQFNKLPGLSEFSHKDSLFGDIRISKQIFIFFISIYFGFFIISNYFILLSLLKIKFGFLNAAIFSLVFCAAFIFIRILKFKKAGGFKYSVYPSIPAEGQKREIIEGTQTGENSKDEQNEKINKDNRKDENNKGGQREKTGKLSLAFQVIFSVFIFINFCVVIFFTFLFPIRFWDAISCWSLKGRAFFLDASVMLFFTQHNYDFSHLSYPLYISLSQTWIYIWLGGINETLVKVIFPLFYLSLIFIVYYLLRKEVKRLYAVISVFILSALPVIMDHGYLEYTNLIFSVILLLGVYYFYIYILKRQESQKNDKAQNQNTYSQSIQSQAAQNQTARDRYAQVQSVQNQNRQIQSLNTGQHIPDNLKNLMISAIFFAILTSIRLEGIFFLVIFLIINTTYNLVVLIKRLPNLKICSIAAEGSLSGVSGNSADCAYKHEYIKNDKSGIGIYDHDACKYERIKSIKSSKRRNIIFTALVSMILPAALIFLLLAPWTVLQAKLNISGASTEWVPVIAGLKGGFKDILNGSLFMPGGSNEISSLFSFKNASGAFLGEFLFSKFDSARAFLGSSYGIAWIALAVIAAVNFKKLFKAFNWIFFVFLSAGFLALFISLGFIPEFAWSTERYMLHLFPLAYFWIIRSYLSNTILFKSSAPEK